MKIVRECNICKIAFSTRSQAELCCLCRQNERAKISRAANREAKPCISCTKPFSPIKTNKHGLCIDCRHKSWYKPQATLLQCIDCKVLFKTNKNNLSGRCHPCLLSFRNKVDYQNNKDKYLARGKDWRPKNRKKVQVYNQSHRARLLASPGKFTSEEWNALCAQYEYKCLCCRSAAKLTIDHIVPLILGGVNTIDNLQPLCKPCNSRKGIKVIDYRKGIEDV